MTALLAENVGETPAAHTHTDTSHADARAAARHADTYPDNYAAAYVETLTVYAGGQLSTLERERRTVRGNAFTYRAGAL